MSNLQWVKPPHCQWAGRLIFDGAVARIEGDIRFDGVARQLEEIWRLEGYCQRLDLALAEPIDLRQARGSLTRDNPTARRATPSASVERIILQENVDLRIQQLDLLGNAKSLERIVVPVLTFHVVEQQLVGGGEGWINSKFLSQSSGLGQLASRETAAAKQPTLQGAHLIFRDSMVAFLDRNEIVFDGKVRLAAGPLRNWDDAIDLNKMTQLTVEQMLLNCDQLKVVDTSGLSTTVALQSNTTQALEFQATGNVSFEGKADTGTYLGSAHQTTYVQLKDQLILRGDGRTPAMLKKVPANSQVEATWQGYVNEATINIKTLGITNFQLAQAQVELPGAGASANAPAAPDPRSGVTDFLQPRP
ncbi:MAG: hypothetical protein R3C53_12130 [Pirellulaceae bacterium]